MWSSMTEKVASGFTRCETCGEFNGTTDAVNLSSSVGFIWTGKVTVTCLCSGVPCLGCRTHLVHAPAMNSYDAESNSIRRWPSLGGEMLCRECRSIEASKTKKRVIDVDAPLNMDADVTDLTSAVDKFFDAWKSAGFQPVGHIVFRKTYSSSSMFLSYQHEQPYLLAKGRPPLPKRAIADVMDMPYSGNKLHPTQKPIEPLTQLICSFTLPGELVLDPFAGSGSTCAAALLTGRNYIGMELDAKYLNQASARLARVSQSNS